MLKKLKRLYRHAQRLKRSRANSAKRSMKREKDIKKAHKRYIDESQVLCARARITLDTLSSSGGYVTLIKVYEIEHYLRHADRQIDQIKRRVLEGEKVPHEEKVFSIFQPHTEWISKGKAGVSQELGVKVCIVEDQYRFILAHHVMSKTTDVEMAVPLMEKTKRRYPEFTSCSFDKGFYSPGNVKALSEILEQVVLPKKGKRNATQDEKEKEEEFAAARAKHSGVESAINALENHGLDRCPDNGVTGFKRYVGLAVLARNIQVLGMILWKQETEQRERKRGSREDHAA